MDFNLVSLIIAFAGFLVTYAVYQLSKQQLRESWLQTYGEIHTLFWNDSDIKKIRCCLGYELPYAELRSLLIHYRELIENPSDQAKDLVEDEYLLMDQLDKYLNLLERAGGIRPELRRHRDLWKALFFHYWLDLCMNPTRPELVWYMNKHYQDLVKIHREVGV